MSTSATISHPFHWLTDSSEMGERIRDFDWANTSLGSADSWSPALRMMTRFMLANRFPMMLWWGPQYVSFYNDPYRPVLGAKHPWALGKPVSECWSEIWHVLKPLIDTPFHGGPATWDEDILLELNRYGFVEETHFGIAYSPVPDETVASGIGGVLATVHETTEKVVGERRVVALRDLAASAGEARTVGEACRVAARTLSAHDRDMPFVLLYLIDADGRYAQLAGSAGCADDESVCPARIDLHADAQHPWPLADVVRTQKLQIIDDLGRVLGSATPPGPWSDPPREAVLLPIRSNVAHQLVGVLVTGVSARLKLNELYRGFLDLVAGQIATAIAGAQAYEIERKRAEALAEIDRAKTTFFSNVSHELRTPLTLILGPLQDALADPEPALPRDRLEMLHRNVLRLQKLVNTLLDFSRIEAGRMQANYEPTDLAAVTAELSSVFRSAVEKAGMQLIVRCARLDMPVYVDRDMFEKILLNLLSNAFKFTLEGKIEVRLQDVGNVVELSVRDTGGGISASELPHVFERFHRIEGVRARTLEGTGIGLAFVQELVRLHGGSVAVQSVEGQGSTFTVTLPKGSNHLPPDRIGIARELTPSALADEYLFDEMQSWLPSEAEADHSTVREAAASVTQNSMSPQTSTRARIVWADDNADMRDYVRRLLSAKFDVEAVANGTAALAAVRRERPDLVLADVMMPGVDGFALLRALRENDDTRAIPVVLLSARAGEEAQVDGMQAGADDYLVKPFSARELLARVGAHVGMARQRRAHEARTAADLQAVTRLFEMGNRCAQTGIDFQACMDEIVDAAMALTGADKANLQIVEQNAGTLKIAAQRGFDDAFLAFFKAVRLDDASVCAAALQAADRIIVEDVTQSALFAGQPSLHVLLEASVRAVQSTPLISSGGTILGVISTHFCQPHCLGERELRLLDLLARQAADLLERKQAEHALQLSETRYRTLFDSIDEGYCIVEVLFDDEGKPYDYLFEEVNQSFERHTGIHDAVGRSMRDIEPNHDLHWFEAYGRIAKSGTPERFVSLAAALNRWYDVYAFRIGMPEEHRVAILFRDITDRRKAEEELQEADRRKDEFLATLAHELRNPLAPIRNGLHVLRLAGDHGGKSARIHEMLEGQVNHMVRLVDDLMEVSRITGGKVELRKEHIDLASVLRSAVEISEPLIDAAHHRLVINLPAESLIVDADAVRLAQVVANLLNNAAKYTNDRGRIWLTARREGSAALISVRDDGIGIPQDMLPKVFDLFTQVERTYDRAQGGLGIGLTLVRSLVELHGGSVDAISEGNDKGSEFIVRLPLAQQTSATKQLRPADMWGKAARQRILVVDDNRDAGDTLGMILKSLGAEVCVVRDGPAAFTALKAFPADVVLLDIGMPEMDGYEVARRLRQQVLGEELTLIAVTGWGQEEDRRRSGEAGFDHHLVKPVDIAVLEKLLTRLPAKKEFQPSSP